MWGEGQLGPQKYSTALIALQGVGNNCGFGTLPTLENQSNCKGGVAQGANVKSTKI